MSPVHMEHEFDSLRTYLGFGFVLVMMIEKRRNALGILSLQTCKKILKEWRNIYVICKYIIQK